jgi:hypothetical protein
MKTKISKYDKALAMNCYSKLAVSVARDPNPQAKEQLEKEFNCTNCDTYKYCCKLAKV